MPVTHPATSLYTADQVRRIDRTAIQLLGIPGIELMRRAAGAAFKALRQRWPEARRIVLLAGNGNNGGDAFLLGLLALRAGLSADAIALGPRSTGDAEQARTSFVAAGGRIVIADVASRIPHADVVVDGLFGTGLGRPVDGVAAGLIERLNASGRPVLALDVPSGLDADTGIARPLAVRADMTISFVAWKRGLFNADGPAVSGARELALLDLPATVHAGIDADAELLDDAATRLLPPRENNVNKGSFGHVLAIGGDSGFGGAIRLSAEAALRCGAGLVSVATRAAHVSAFNAARPELMARGIEVPGEIVPLIARASVLAIGPGLGQREWGRELLDIALASGKPLVLDADALNLLALAPRALPAQVVLTPHPGEAARLLDSEAAAVQRDRFAVVRALAAQYGAVVVLKGAGSLIGDPRGRVALCPWGNPGMASAGMGDVLTGVIAAMLAQGLSAWDAARSGVAVHARAGDMAAGTTPRGLIASDLFAPLRQLVNGAST